MDSQLADKLQAYVKGDFAHGLQVIIVYTLVPLKTRTTSRLLHLNMQIYTVSTKKTAPLSMLKNFQN